MIPDSAIGNNFFGRRDLLELLKKRSDDLRHGYRQNIAIIGPSYYGKTSVICRFMDSFPHGNAVVIYVDANLRGFSSFADKFTSTLLFRYLTSIGYKIDGFEQLIAVASEKMPKTLKAVKAYEALVKSGKISQAYASILELPAIAYAETAIRPIIILDEFHMIADFGVDNAFAVLGRHIMLQKDTMYIVTSSQTNKAKEILSEKLSLLFGNFEICELETFDTATAVNFINFRLGANTLPTQFVDFLVAFTGGHPFYLDNILFKLGDTLNLPRPFLSDEGKAPSSAGIMEAITKTFAEILFDSKGILNRHFVNVVAELEKVDERYTSALFSIANGNKSVQSISAGSHLKAGELRPLLDRLVNLGWIVNNGALYLICDKVFEFWLKNVCQNKGYLLDIGYDSKISKFNQEICECLNKYAIACGENFIQRVSGLFLSFNGELVDINSKSFRFPKFDTADVREAKTAGVFYMLLSNRGSSRSSSERPGLWIALASLMPLTDNDVTDFLTFCKKHGKDVKRKIIISPCVMSANTMLISKEAKSLIWSQKELNELLDIAGRQRMVLFDLGKALLQNESAADVLGMETA